jgi:plasmid stabilization system protein ParE
MSYQIQITSIAERDIINAADYIEYNLKNPIAAENLLDEVTLRIESLSEFPERFGIVDDSVLASWKIRFVTVNNYLAFYTIDEDMQLVIVVRFLFQNSNWKSILRHGFSLI